MTAKIKILLTIIAALFVALLCLIYLNINQSEPVTVYLPTPTNTPTPTTITTIVTSLTTNPTPIIKLTSYTDPNSQVTFLYPTKWGIDSSQQNFVRVYEDSRISNHQDDSLSIKNVFGGSLEQLKQSAINYYANSTSGLADEYPEIIFQNDINFQGMKAFQYTYKLTKPYDPRSNIVTQIFVPLKDSILDIKLRVSDQKLLDTIKKSFKFPKMTILPTGWRNDGIPIVRGSFEDYITDDGCVALVINQPQIVTKTFEDFLKDNPQPDYRIQFTNPLYLTKTIPALNTGEINNTYLMNSKSVYLMTAMAVIPEGPPTCKSNYDVEVKSLINSLVF